MQDVFLELLKLSLIGSLFAAAVMLVRLVFRKAPKWLFCMLWGVVALRLICPVSIESGFSVIPNELADGQIIANVGEGYVGAVDIIYEDNARYGNALEAGRKPVNSQSGQYVVTEKGSLEAPKTVGETVYPVLTWVWLAGMILMISYMAASYLLLRRKMAEATCLKENVWQCERVESPFVLGIFVPRIYLPYTISDSDMENVLAHERAHIRRKDHWWKPLGFLLLSVHWFNPVLWIAYILLCRDIEAACDEKVIKNMEKEELRAYSAALLRCSVHHCRIAACPLAFGEQGVKGRIKHIMSYKKPAFWLTLVALVVCVAVAGCFATQPGETEGQETGNSGVAQREDDATGRLLALVDQIAYNPECAASSNPFTYIEAGKVQYNEILSYGPAAVECFVAQLRAGENGLRGYIMAVACADITGIGDKDEGADWATAQEWLALYEQGGQMPPDTHFTGGDQPMTLADVITLSRLGMELTWEDLKPYKGEDVGSGLYIVEFDIDSEFFLQVGDGKTSAKPMYAFLNAKSTGAACDIRETDVEAFIRENQKEAIDYAIYKAIIERNSDGTSPQMPTGLLPTASYYIFAMEGKSGTPLQGQTNHMEETTVYLQYVYTRYYHSGGELDVRKEISTAAVITFALGQDGYQLKEFWEPNPGNSYAADVRGEFPAEAADQILDPMTDGWRAKELRDRNYSKIMAYLADATGESEGSGTPVAWIHESNGPSEFFFRFAFDVPYTKIVASCDQGALVDADSNTNIAIDEELTIRADNALYWIPKLNSGEFHETARITFKLYDGERVVAQGSLNLIGCPYGEDSSVYIARLDCAGFELQLNSQNIGALVAVIPE